MKSILYMLAMCLGLIFGVQADENFDLDDVTIELVEEGEEIAHQIHIPFIEEVDQGARELTRGSEQASADVKSESTNEQVLQPAEVKTVTGKGQADEFLDLIGDAEELEELLESEQQEAMALADEILQQAEEEIHELEADVEQNNDELQEERRDEEALIDAIKRYEDEEKEENEEEPEDTDDERDEEEGIEGVSREGALD